MGEKLRACLIGCGRMGATIDDEVKDRPDAHLFLPYSHAAGYEAVEEVELVAACDLLPEKVRAAQERYGIPRGYTDYREMILEERPDIVSVATRPKSHAEIVIFAAEHGVRGIFCEKPLCCSMEEADRMLEACRRGGVKFNYGTLRRYVPLYRTMRRLAEEGELGEISCVIAHCPGSAQWGLTHASDMLLFLAGDPEVDFVQGYLPIPPEEFEGNRLEIDPLIPMGFVRFKNSVLGYLTRSPGWEFELVGSEGKVRSLNNGLGLQLRKRDEHGRFVEVEPPKFPYQSGTLNAIRELVEAIKTDGETSGDIALAHRSQEMILGFIESGRLGGVKVEMPLKNRSLYVCRPDW